MYEGKDDLFTNPLVRQTLTHSRPGKNRFPFFQRLRGCLPYQIIRNERTNWKLKRWKLGSRHAVLSSRRGCVQAVGAGLNGN